MTASTAAALTCGNGLFMGLALPARLSEPAPAVGIPGIPRLSRCPRSHRSWPRAQILRPTQPSEGRDPYWHAHVWEARAIAAAAKTETKLLRASTLASGRRPQAASRPRWWRATPAVRDLAGWTV